jgi:hypothetical protein
MPAMAPETSCRAGRGADATVRGLSRASQPALRARSPRTSSSSAHRGERRQRRLAAARARSGGALAAGRGPRAVAPPGWPRAALGSPARAARIAAGDGGDSLSVAIQGDDVAIRAPPMGFPGRPRRAPARRDADRGGHARLS